MRIARGFSLCVLWCLVACAGRVGSGHYGPLTQRHLDRAAALAPDDHEGHTALALDLGLDQKASRSASKWLAHAHARALLAEAQGASGSELRRARAEHVRAARAAIRVGRRVGDGDLVLDASLTLPRSKTDDLRWGAEHTGYWIGDESSLLVRAQSDPQAWLAVYALLYRDSDWDDETAVLDPLLAKGPLHETGIRGNPIRHRLLDQLLRQGTLSQPAIELAASIAEHDPSDVPAQLLLEFRAATENGTMIADDDLYTDVVDWPALSALSRIRRRSEFFPDAPAVQLHYAWALMDRGLSGDALAVLRAHDGQWDTASLQRLASLLEASALLVEGKPQAYAAWLETHDVETPLHQDQWLEDWWQQVTVPDHRPAADSVLGRAFDASFRRRAAARDKTLGAFALARLTAAKLDRRTRTWVDERLDQDMPLARLCLDQGGTAERCSTRQSQFDSARWALATEGLQRDNADTLLRWVHAEDLDADGRAKLEAAADTTLAFSSGFADLYGQVLLEQGRHEELGRWLERVGPALPARTRVSLWLSVADLRRGIDFETTPYGVDLDWPEAGYGRGEFDDTPLPDDASWVARRRRADQLVTHERYAEAETLYRGLAADLPPEDAPTLLVLSARAALEAGRIAAAQADLAQLPTDHAWRQELEGLVLARTGDVDGARKLLLDVWPRRASAGGHLLKLGVSLATKPTLELFQRYADTSWLIKSALEAGQIETLAALVEFQAIADDPPRGWSKPVEEIPEQLRILVRVVGSGKLDQASSATAARPLATKLLALERLDAHPNRATMLELMLLTGEHDAALSLARSDDPRFYAPPLGSKDDLVRLHEAGARGLLSPDDLWEVWLWRNDAGGGDTIADLVGRAESGETGPVLGYACILLAERPEDERSLPVCKKAWEAEADDGWQATVNYSYLLLQQTPPDLGALTQVFARTAPVAFRPDAAPIRDREDLSIYMQNRSAWYATTGEHEQAAQARIDSYAFSRWSDPQSNDLPEGQYPFRGEHARAGTVVGAIDNTNYTLAKLAYQALRGHQPEVSRHYARVNEAVGVQDDELAAVLGSARTEQLAVLQADDLASEHAPPAQLGEAAGWAFSLGEGDVERAEVLHEAAPDAALPRFALARAANEGDRFDDALKLLAPLEARFPTHLSVAIEGARARVGSGDIDGAKARIAQVASAHAGAVLLEHAPLPESVVGERASTPSWVRDETAFARAIDAVSTADMMALVPEYRRHTDVHGDAFFPLAWRAKDDDPLSGYGSQGEWVLVSESARASRCEGELCLRPSIDDLEALGYTTHFTRTVQLPAGEATEAAFSNSRKVWLAVSIPAGGRVFTVLASAPTERAHAMLQVYALVRASFAPLDGVVPSFAAASLRADGDTTLVDRLQLRTRLQAHANDTGCPLQDTLADVTPTVAAELLLDVYLASPAPAMRRRILSCVTPKDRRARRLGLVALLDDDAAVHDWGRQAVFRHASRAMRDRKHVLPLGLPTSAPDYFDRDDEAPRGVLELGLALPPKPAWALFEELRKKDDTRTTAWLIASQRTSLIDDPQVAVQATADPDPEVASLAFEVLDAHDADLFRRTARERLDQLGPDTITEAGDWLAWSLAYSLVPLGEPSDGPRLRAVARRFDVEGRKGLSERLTELAERHTKLLKGTAADDDADTLHARQRRGTLGEQAPRTAEVLASTPLPQLLPTRHWTFARVASPGLFASTLLDLDKRLDSGDATTRLMVARMLESVRESRGFDTLLEGGGLDLSQPIECASMAGDRGFLCSATVADRDALLTELGRRSYGSDAGPAIVLDLSRGAGFLPGALSLLPAFLHDLVYERPDEGPRPDPSTRRYERLRHRVEIAGHMLHYYAIAEFEDGSVGFDAERYLFLDDRVFVFSNDFVARQVLFAPEAGSPTLGSDPEFVALTRSWKDGSALQAAAMGLASPVDDASMASEVVADSEGFAFRYSATTDAEIADMAAAHHRLPEGAVSTFTVGYPAQQDTRDLSLSERVLAEGDVTPPAALLPHSTGAAFGWYPAEGDPLWKRWAVVLPTNPALRKAAKKLGVRRPAATPKQAKDGWWYAQVDGQLLVASDEGLVRQALERPAAPSGGPHLLGRGTFDGDRAAAVVEALPTTASDLERVTLRFFAAVIGVVKSVRFDATWDPSTRVGSMQGRVTLNLQSREASEVVDQWLAAAQFRNAAQLPRTLGDDEAQGTLRFTLSVDDAEGFVAKSVDEASARIQARALDAHQVELVVRAKATDAAATEALSPARKRRLLETSSQLRIHDDSIEKIRDTLLKADMDSTAKARAITEWVHERIAYEITPRSVDASEVLRVGRGDCSEYALLSVSLLRSAGIPAEVRSGMAAQGNDMVAHAWVAYHDGKRWHEVDPTWGRMAVTAGHLPLEVSDVLALVSLGALSIERIEVVKDSL